MTCAANISFIAIKKLAENIICPDMYIELKSAKNNISK